MQIKKFLPYLIPVFIGFFTGVLPAVADSRTSPDQWRYSMTPYLLHGMAVEKTSLISKMDTLSLAYSEKSPEQKDPGQKLYIKMQNNDWSVFAHYQYMNADSAAQMRSDYKPVDLKAQITELGASYRFATWNDIDFEILAGTRYILQDTGTSLDRGQFTYFAERDEWWRYTFAGIRFFNRLSENWTFIGRGDVGAGINGENIGWNAVAMLDYQLEDSVSLYFGYKLLGFHDDNIDTGMERYSYDALEQGPFTGLTLRW